MAEFGQSVLIKSCRPGTVTGWNDNVKCWRGLERDLSSSFRLNCITMREKHVRT